MTIFKYNGKIDKLMYQNNADCIDIIEGCLLDNYLLEARRGYMAILETYVNSNSSCYTVYFSKNPKEIYRIWDKIQEA